GELRLPNGHLRVEQVLDREQRDDVRARLARKELVARLTRLLGELLPDLTRTRAVLFALERARELLLEVDVLRLERHRLANRGERVVGHVVLEVHVGERRERARTRGDRGEDALPRLNRERRVSFLEVVVAEVHEVRRIRAPDLREAR